MSGKAVGLSLGYGYAGNVSRTPDCIIEARPLNTASANVPFGHAVVQNTDNTYSSAATVTLTATNFAGVAVAEVRQLPTYQIGVDQTQTGEYTPELPMDVIKRGIVAVKCVNGAPTSGGAVYVRKTANVSFPDEAVGDFRAAADGANTVQLTNAVWNTNLIDSNKIAELKLRIINN